MSLEILNELSTRIDISPVAMAGYFLLIGGMIAMFVSKQRYLLLFTLAGMAYWMMVEILQAGITQLFPVSSWHGYVIAMMIGWLPMVAWVIYRGNQQHKKSFSYHLYQKHIHTQGAELKNTGSHIEHTPVYHDYQPEFK